MTKQVKVQNRKEMEIIQEGVSCTETSIALYIHIRKGNKIIRIRVFKDSLELRSYTVEEND